MFEIDFISDSVREALLHNKLNLDAMQLAAFCDRDSELRRGEHYLFADEASVYVASGRTEENGAWKISSLETYALDECDRFFVEEQLSTGRLLVRVGEETRLVACFSNECKSSVFLFVKYVERIKKGEFSQVDPDDRREAKFCPKCGMRYPDANRRVCPNCMEKGKQIGRAHV